jgi:uncharacterized protein (DUF362 family)
MDNQTKVVAIQHDDKLTALDQVLSQTGFFELLERDWQNSGKERADFLIAIKPNIMMANSKGDPSTITDPELVEHLIDGIVARGFKDIAVVESQNTYSNWFHNRDVITVALHFGYSQKNYRLVDMTKEMVSYNFGGRLGLHPIGPTWRDADFRISFAKNKTHISCYFTLTLKNLYGCMPMQNKMKEYHQLREFDWPTIEMMKHFYCHYGLIDGFWSADGLIGLKGDYSPRHTKTIIGGQDIVAVDWVGAKKMGLDPFKSCIFELAATAFGSQDVDWVGDQSTYENWTNVSPIIDQILDVGEESYVCANWIGFLSSDMDSAFPPKITHRFALFIRRVVTSLLRIFSRYEGLRIFQVTAPAGSALEDEPQITHRFTTIVRPLKRLGFINVFELASTVPAYKVDKFINTD